METLPIRKARLRTWRTFRTNTAGVCGLAIIALFGLGALLHPILMHTVWDPRVYDPVTGYDTFFSWSALYGIDGITHPARPSWQWLPNFLAVWRAGRITLWQVVVESLRHPLGTDPLGRDICSQLLYSAGGELLLGTICALVAVCIGTTVGTVAAYFGGVIDTLFMRFADIVMLFPAIPFLLVLGSMMELDLVKLAVVLGILSGFGSIAVVLKSQALSVKVKPFVEAARVIGGGHVWILRKHIIPQVLPLAFLYMMFSVTAAIATEASLSFFGLLGVRTSWGLMIHLMEASGYLPLFAQYWWLWLPPSLAITLFCAAFYMIGRSMEAVINPRLRRR